MIMQNGKHQGVTFSGDLQEGTLSGEFDDCDFRGLNLLGVRLLGIFRNCKFEPNRGIKRQKVAWDGEFPGSTGVREM